jgi:hypothetical protein
MVAEIVKNFSVTHLLDYGAGKNLSLFRALGPKLKAMCLPYKVTFQAYDPGVPEMAAAPVPAQMVTCIDVLEHIEPDLLDNVLDDLVRVTQGILFATVATGPAFKHLSDGRNAHLTQQPMKWWLPKFWDRFDLQSVVMQKGGFMMVLYSKAGKIEKA